VSSGQPGFDGVATFFTVRTVAHVPAAVFAAFADGARLARWWGPSGFRNTFEVFEFVAGGAWVFAMHSPDGKAYPNRSRFEAVEPNSKVVVRHESAPEFTLTVTLAPEGAGTVIRWEQRFDSPQVAAGIRQVVEPANEQNLDRLEAELAGR